MAEREVAKRKRAPGAGRKPQGQISGLTSVISIRMPNEMRKELEAAANKSGKSVTQELLRRLQDSFHRDRDKSRDPGLRALCFLIGEAAERVGALRSALRPGRAPLWRNDRFSFAAFKLTVAKLLDILEPEEELKSPLTVEVTESALRKIKSNFKMPPELADYILKSYKSPEALSNSIFLNIWSALLRATAKSEEPKYEALLRATPKLRKEWEHEFYAMSDARRDLGIKLRGKGHERRASHD